MEEALIEMYLAGVSVGRVEDSVGETLTYYDFPYEHWTRIRTNRHGSVFYIFSACLWLLSLHFTCFPILFASVYSTPVCG